MSVSSRPLSVIVAIASAVGGCSAPATDAPVSPGVSARAEVTEAASVEPTAVASASAAAPVEPTAVATASASSDPGADPLGSKDAKRATDAVLALPGVKGLCKEAIARGAASCLSWATDAPGAPCHHAKVVPYEDNECMWGVGLFETMEYPDGTGHANRIATFWVDPKSFDVKWASAMECADLLFTMTAFRELKRRASSGKTRSDEDRCKGALPYPTAPPP